MAKRICESYAIDSNGSRVSPTVADGVYFGFYNMDQKEPANAPADWKPDVVASRRILISDIKESAPEDAGVVNALTIHGLKARLGESYASRVAKDLNPWEMLDATVNSLMAGEWSSKGERASRSAAMVEKAILRLLEDAGQEADEAMIAAIKAQLSTKEGVEALMADPDINAAYQTIVAEAAAERAKKARAKAAEAAKTGGSAGFLSKLLAGDESEAEDSDEDSDDEDSDDVDESN